MSVDHLSNFGQSPPCTTTLGCMPIIVFILSSLLFSHSHLMKATYRPGIAKLAMKFLISKVMSCSFHLRQARESGFSLMFVQMEMRLIYCNWCNHRYYGTFLQCTRYDRMSVMFYCISWKLFITIYKMYLFVGVSHISSTWQKICHFHDYFGKWNTYLVQTDWLSTTKRYFLLNWCALWLLVNATFNNTSAISWRSVLLVKETGVTTCCIEYTSPGMWLELTTLVVIGIDCTYSCKFNCHTI